MGEKSESCCLNYLLVSNIKSKIEQVQYGSLNKHTKDNIRPDTIEWSKNTCAPQWRKSNLFVIFYYMCWNPLSTRANFQWLNTIQ